MYKTSVYTLVAVNKCRPIGLNRCFVHLYLLFYHKNQVLCWWSIINHLLSTAMKKLNLKYFGVTILIFRGHVTSSITWPSDSAWALFYWWSMMTMRLSCRDTEIRGFKDFGVTSLFFGGHVTSSVTWPLDSAHVVSYWRSIGITRLSCTVTEI